MPEHPPSKLHVPAPVRDLPPQASPPVRYVELHCKTNFSFLEGASHPDELVAQAARLGYAGMAVTDRNSLAGAVRAHVAAKEVGLKLLIGAEITLVDASPILLWAMNRAGLWPALSTLDPWPSSGSQGRMSPRLRGCRRARERSARRCLADDCRRPRSRNYSGGGKSFPIEPTRWPSCIAALAMAGDWTEWQRAALAARVPLIAAGDVHYHDARRRYLQDVLTAIRLKTTVAELGPARFPNGERRLRALEEILPLFAQCPAAVSRTAEVADRCTFSLDELRYEYPEELCPAGETPIFLPGAAHLGRGARALPRRRPRPR